MNQIETTEKFGTELPVERIEFLRDYCYHMIVEQGRGAYSMKQALIDAIDNLEIAHPQITERPPEIKEEQERKRAERIAKAHNTRQRRKNNLR